MRRNHIFSLWLFLLCLFPTLTLAQTLTRYEYWFDDNFDARQWEALSGTDEELNVGIDATQLDDGIHKFSFRVRQSDGKYSAISSSLFMKTTPGEATRLEYWIDGDITTRKFIDDQSVSAGGFMVDGYLDLSEVTPGVHRLFLRGRSDDNKVVSAVTSVPILVKPSMPQENKVIYWIDDNYDQKESVSIDKSLDVNSLDLDLADNDKYPVGFHRLNMQVNLEGQGESAVHSDGFFKSPAGQPSLLEYWFDGDITTRKHVDGESVSTGGFMVNGNLDLSNVSPSAHRLFMRGRGDDNKVVSAVTTVPILVKPSMPQENKVIYWIDDNYDQKESVSIDKSLDVHSLDLDLADNAKYPVGFHRLNMQVNLEGQGESAVHSDGFFKSPAGQPSLLEYWFDGNITTRKHVNGESVSTGGFMVNGNLDLSNVSPGAHRLFMRGRGDDNKVVSAVTSVPVMVKSRYNVDNIDDLTVTTQAFWIDDEEPEIHSVAHPGNIITQPYVKDLRKLSDGQHTVHVQFANSAGIWNAPLSQTFTKAKVNEPMIVMNGSVEDGVVTLKFNSVAYGQHYTVVRKYESGKLYKVEGIDNYDYPAALKSTDTPAPGTYTYYVEGSYIDADGVRQKVRSGDVALTVESAASTVKRGSINIILLRDGKKNTLNNCQSKMFVNGEEVHDMFSSSGLFTISNVPYGKELTISVEDEYWNYNDVTIIANESTCGNTLYLDGKKGEVENNDQPNNTAYDLTIVDKVHITPNTWEVKVWNGSSNPWLGNIIVKVISKKVKDLYDRQATEGSPSVWYYLFHPNAGLDQGPVLTLSADKHVRIEGRSQVVVSLDIKDLPESDSKKNEDYYVYVFTKKDGFDQLKELNYGGDDSCRNPQTLTFNPKDYYAGSEKDLMDYMNDYVEVMKWVKKFTDWGDPFKLAWETGGDGFNKYIEALEKGEEEFTLWDEDLTSDAVKSSGMLLNVFFNDIHKSVKKYTDNFTKNTAYKAYAKIQELQQTIDGFAIASQADDNHKFFELAKQVLKIAKKWNDPVVDCYMRYFEVGEAMASAVEQLANSMNKPYVFNKLASGNSIYKIKVRKYYDGKNWGGYFNGEDFYPHKDYRGIKITHSGQIRSIKVELLNPANGVIATGIPATVELDNDGITVKDVEFDKYQTEYFTMYEAWMAIEWNNNRVTHVPLLDKNFVKLANADSSENPLTATIELQSEAFLDVERIANQIEFVEP